MIAAQSLVAQLRRRITDERVSRTAFRLACVDEAATDCLVAISAAGVFSTTVLNGRKAASLSLDLNSSAYRSVRQLIEYLATLAGYQVVAEQDFEPEHPAVDLQVVGSMSVLGRAAAFKCHLFSDSDLLEVLTKACARHNLSYNPQNLPLGEEVFVLMLASAEVCRLLATDAAKRRNLETSVDQLLTTARDLESAYASDTKRQQRAIPVPKFDEELTEQGDVVIGSSFRRSGRTGFMAPMSGALGPTKAVLDEPAPEEVEDTKVRLRWRRNRDYYYYAYELWRDTQPDVQRPKSLQYVTDGPQLMREVVKTPTTAKLVFRSFGPHTNRDNVGWATFIEQAGQLITEYVDTGAEAPDGVITAAPLEPETTYYYRLFIVSLNYEIVGSNVIGVTTKALRALLDKDAPTDVKEGPAGTTVTMSGLRFSSSMRVTLGGKAVDNLIIVSATEATFEVPTFNNPSAKNTRYDLVIISPNGLIDVYAQGFKYTGP